MTYIRLDDQITDHPKIAAAGPTAAWLFVCALCYCSRHLTDGFIPDGAVTQLSNVTKPRLQLGRLVGANLIHEVDGGWQVTDYLQWQRSRAEVNDIKAKRAEAGRKGGSKGGSTNEANGKQTGSTLLSNGEAKDPPESRVQSPESYSSQSSTKPQGSSATDDDDRIEPLALRLGRADHEAAIADGIAIRNPAKHLAACIENRRVEVATVAATMRDATAADLAAVFEPKPDRANPHVPTWEETQARQAAEAAETNLSPEERAAAVAAVKAAATKLKEHR